MRMMKLGAVACFSILSGCSVFGVGSNDFSCPGMPKGIVCKSTGEIYQLTGENNLQALVGDPVDMTVHKSVDDYDSDGASVVRSPENSHNRMFDKPMVKAVDGSIPVLQPAQVLRIWVGPWTDANDNLIWPTYVFTQVKNRTWNFGNSNFEGQKPLVPVQLQVRDQPKPGAK